MVRPAVSTIRHGHTGRVEASVTMTRRHPQPAIVDMRYWKPLACGYFRRGNFAGARGVPSDGRRAVIRRTASKQVLESSMDSEDEKNGRLEDPKKEEDSDDLRPRLEAAYSLSSDQEGQHGPIDAFLGTLISLLGKINDVGQGSAGRNQNGGIYAKLAGEYDVAKLENFFKERPWEVASRLLEFLRMALRVQAKWRSEDDLPEDQLTRGDVLRGAISSLGPVFVKCGQTMAQRADLIGEESANALKSLQSSNRPFPDELAWQTIVDDLGYDGPLSPNCPLRPDSPGKPLFAEFQAEHIASASLGQVYKARTHAGEDIALKVQRPNVLRQVALDMYVLRLGLIILRQIWGMSVDLKPIADEVGTGLFKELDYHLEAQNALDFNKAHAFLGYVRAPKFIPEYSGPRGTAKVLALEWIHGQHIDKLEPERAKLMVAMAVEASVAQLLRTGFVHVDPHEGNMIFTDDDELCYIDFGLMARVHPTNMEAFASGVCHMLAGKYYELSKDFMECGIVSKDDGYVKYTTPGENPVACSQEEFAGGLKKYMEGEEGGKTRFGALATGLAQMSFDFQLKTPPYIILLCRTFLTLEGIAAKVEPNFSIYTAALPFAVRRALSPETPRGKEALRSALLDDSGNFRFDYFSEILDQTETLSGSMDMDEDTAPTMAPSRANSSQKGAKPQSGAETLTGLLGSTDGRPLRKVANEVNTLAMAETMTGPQGRIIRRQGSRALASAILSSMDSDEPELQELPPAAAVQKSLREKEQRRMTRALKVIGGNHMRNLATAGPAGWFAMVKLFFVMVRIICGAILHIIQDEFTKRLQSVFNGKKDHGKNNSAGHGSANDASGNYGSTPHAGAAA